MFHWPRDHNRTKARERPFPPKWEAFIRSNLGHYSVLNDVEFFAVATEKFFDRPLALQNHAPDLHHVLSAYYRQDPAGRVGRTCHDKKE